MGLFAGFRVEGVGGKEFSQSAFRDSRLLNEPVLRAPAVADFIFGNLEFNFIVMADIFELYVGAVKKDVAMCLMSNNKAAALIGDDCACAH